MAKQELDALDDEGGNAAIALLSVASAARSAPASSARSRELAELVLAETVAAIDAGTIGAAAECESIAATFNRKHDVVIDAANASSMKRERATRRMMMAQALDKADLVLIERHAIAALLNRISTLENERGEALIAAGVCSMTLLEVVEHLKDQISELESWPAESSVIVYTPADYCAGDANAHRVDFTEGLERPAEPAPGVND